MPVLKYFGHAAFKISSPKMSILIDPGIINGTPLVSEDERVNVICITHAHLDHFGNAAKIATAQKAFLVGNAETIEKLKEEGAPAWLLRPLPPGESFIRPEVKVTAIDLKHGPSKSSPSISHTAFIVEIGRVKFVHLGDAATRGLLDQWSIDVLLIGIDETETFNPVHALQAVSDLSPKLAIPMHVRSQEEIEYFEAHLPIMAPHVKYKRMEAGEELLIEWAAGTEFVVRPVTGVEP
ncbi:MAG: MBL fold metallo-hydrolase [Candidatus Freyarchaeota archaeon]|nr:MBL fold metallo-hydrolase [Candidatus Freyrarchaeum guaymaensis]